MALLRSSVDGLTLEFLGEGWVGGCGLQVCPGVRLRYSTPLVGVERQFDRMTGAGGLHGRRTQAHGSSSFFA